MHKQDSTKNKTDALHFLIAGYYGWQNLGDELILWQIVNDLKILFPTAKVTVWTNNPSQTKEWVNADTIRYDKVEELSRLIKNSVSHIIVGGGGLIQDYVSLSFHELFSCYKPRPANYILPALIGKYYGKPVFFWAQGLGPIHTEEGMLFTRLYLSLADAGTFRDQDSFLLADSLLGGEHNFAIDVDPVVALDTRKFLDSLGLQEFTIKNLVQQKTNKDKVKIGINLRHFFGQEQLAITYILEILKVLSQHFSNITVVPIPFDLSDDQSALSKLISYLDDQNIEVDPSLLNKPSFLTSIDHLQKSNLFIGMRLHSVIMACKFNIPTIALSYDPKVKNFCNRYKIAYISLEDKSETSLDEVKTELINKVLVQMSQKDYISCLPEYQTPKLFREFVMNSTLSHSYTLPDYLLFEHKYNRLKHLYDNLTNSKAFKLLNLYYKSVNSIRKIFKK